MNLAEGGTGLPASCLMLDFSDLKGDDTGERDFVSFCKKRPGATMIRASQSRRARWRRDE